MMKNPMARIVSTGMCVPDRVVTNYDLEKVMDTSHDWITQRTGIEERRHADEGTTPTDLAQAACERALRSANLKISDIDLLIVATLSPQHYFPGTAVFLQERLGMETKPALDLRAQCSGFIFGLSVGKAMIESGTHKRILVCGVEIQSRALNMTSDGRETAVLFGDGAGAAVLEASTMAEHGILHTILHTEGQHAKRLWVEAPTTASKPVLSEEMLLNGAHRPQMDGKFVFKNAVVRLPQVIREVLEPFSLSPKDIDLFIFHQANLRINEFVANSLALSPSQTFNNINKYGNCSAASVPICLDECVKEGRIKSGSLVCMAAFGSGFTWGANLVRW